MKCRPFFNFSIAVKRYICTLPPEECSCITIVIFLFNCTGTPVAVSLFIKHGKISELLRELL